MLLVLRIFLFMVIPIAVQAVGWESDAQLTFSFLDSAKLDRPLKVCVDGDFWFPYTFTTAGKPVGLHTDIADAAITKAGYSANYIAKSGLECLTAVKNGNVDAIISVAYEVNKAKYIYFPEDAMHEAVSAYRLTQVSYQLITSLRNSTGEMNNYIFQGDIKSLPNPVRVVRGSWLVDFLKQQSIAFMEYDNSLQMLQDLLSSKNGCMLSLGDMIKFLSKKQEQFNSQLLVHKQIVASKSFFIGFSKKTDVSRKVRRKIWQEVSVIRNDRLLADKLLERYILI